MSFHLSISLAKSAQQMSVNLNTLAAIELKSFNSFKSCFDKRGLISPPTLRMKIILFLLCFLTLACASAFQQTTSGGPPKNFLICDCLLTVGIADTVMIEQSPKDPQNIK